MTCFFVKILIFFPIRYVIFFYMFMFYTLIYLKLRNNKYVICKQLLVHMLNESTYPISSTN